MYYHNARERIALGIATVIRELVDDGTVNGLEFVTEMVFGSHNFSYSKVYFQKKKLSTHFIKPSCNSNDNYYSSKIANIANIRK